MNVQWVSRLSRKGWIFILLRKAMQIALHNLLVLFHQQSMYVLVYILTVDNHIFEIVCVNRSKSSSKLISTDNHNNTANVKWTISMEISPLCKDDLLILPRSIAQRCGSISSVVLVTLIMSCIRIVDPVTCKRYILRQLYNRT